MLEAVGIQNILIGNAYASEEEFQAIQEVLCEPRKIEESPIYEVIKGFGTLFGAGPERKLKVIPDPAITETERYMLFDFFPQADFGDSSEWIWRSRSGRMNNKSRDIPPRPFDCEYFEPGDVLIVNDSYKHYSGEVQIARLPIKNDGQRNRIAKLADNEIKMLELIQDGDAIRFLKNKN